MSFYLLKSIYMPRHPKVTDRISAIPVLLRLLQSLLWYNDNYKVFFSTRHTNNPQEYYYFILDIKSGQRKHGRYKVTTDDIIVHFPHSSYKVKELANMRRYEIEMIQTTNTENELDYANWLGAPIPAEKGLPYKIED